MATLRDIAKHAGVSQATASLAVRDHESISLETRQRVWEAQEKLGYRVNQMPARVRRHLGRSGNNERKTIGFLMVDRRFDDPVYIRSFQGFSGAVASRDWRNVHLMASLRELHEGKLPSALKEREIDGFLVTGMLDEVAYRKLKQCGIPFIVLGNYNFGDEPWAACEIDLALGLRLLLKRLSGFGHTRFGFLLNATATESERKLHQWYLEEIEAKGVSNAGIVVASEEESISEAARRLLHPKTRPTALLLSTETLAEEVYAVCEAAHLHIPRDISIAAIGSGIYRMRPSLANIQVCSEEYGALAMEKLVTMMEHPGRMLTRELFPMHFASGGSIGKAPEKT